MSSYEPYQSKLIDCKRVKPFVDELVRRFGTAEAAATYAMVATSTIRRIQHEKHCSVHAVTARKIIVALDHKREEDKVHARLLKQRQKQVEVEDSWERLVGY